jgi:TolA-binding protein
VFDNLATTFPDNIFADKARLELGLIELSASRYENADMYLSYLGKARTDDIGAKAQYYYGLSLFEQKKYNDAITALLRVRNFFSRYEEWVTRSFLLLGDCYVKINDKRSAEEMYRAVLAKYAGTPFGKEAQEKLRKLR